MLKAFLLDKDMTDLEVEAKYVEMASEKSKVNWEELPLDELEKIYSTDEQRKWLQDKVVSCSNLKHFTFYGFVFLSALTGTFAYVNILRKFDAEAKSAGGTHRTVLIHYGHNISMCMTSW